MHGQPCRHHALDEVKWLEDEERPPLGEVLRSRLQETACRWVSVNRFKRGIMCRAAKFVRRCKCILINMFLLPTSELWTKKSRLHFGKVQVTVRTSTNYKWSYSYSPHKWPKIYGFAGLVISIYPPGNSHIPYQGPFEDDFPSPKLGSVTVVPWMVLIGSYRPLLITGTIRDPPHA